MSGLVAPIAPRLFIIDADGEPLLLGGRDRETRRIAFPAPADEERFEIVPLPRRPAVVVDGAALPSEIIDVADGCTTVGSAMFGAYSTIRSGELGLGIAVGFDKHPPGAFDPGLPIGACPTGMATPG